jgi:hypothetical protein
VYPWEYGTGCETEARKKEGQTQRMKGIREIIREATEEIEIRKQGEKKQRQR